MVLKTGSMTYVMRILKYENTLSDSVAQATISWFLIGYAVGQLIYGPLANRFGRKPALYAGIGLQIISSLLCVLSGITHHYTLLIFGRFLLALGSGVGLKMAFTLVNESYESVRATQLLSYLMIAFAITPGLSIALGGLLITRFAWTSTFYVGALYGVVLLLLSHLLSETKTVLDRDALKFHRLMSAYLEQFKNIPLLTGGLLMGCATSFIYLFAALAPFMAINLLNMPAASYGFANLIPSVGLAMGSLIAARAARRSSPLIIVKRGIIITAIGVLLMLTGLPILIKFITAEPLALSFA